MKINDLRKFIANAVVSGFAIVALSSIGLAVDDENKKGPELPPGCGAIQVQAGHKVSFHTYAVGVQIYRWNGASWDFVAPLAKLYVDSGFHGLVGDHYAGPTWESNSGSTVTARRVDGCSPDTTAIPWLLLEAVTTGGKGVFTKTTFIQRVTTAGGVAPSTPGAFVGVEQKVPYLAEYYFYRSEN